MSFKASPGREVIKFVFMLSKQFQLLIKTKMLKNKDVFMFLLPNSQLLYLTTVVILIFISMIDVMLS